MEGKKNRILSESQLCWTILVIFILLLGGFFYWQMWRWGQMVEELHGGSYAHKEESSEDLMLPQYKLKKGISIVSDGDVQIIKSSIDSFVVTIPKGYYVIPSVDGSISIQDFEPVDEAYGVPIGCKSIFLSEPGTLSDIEVSSKKFCGADMDCEYYSVEQKKYNSNEWFEIKYFGQYIGSGWPMYVTEHSGMLYKFYFQCNDQSYIDIILHGFTLN